MLTSRVLAVLVLSPVLALSACQSAGGRDADSIERVVPAASPDQKAALLGRVQGLQGTWAKVDEQGVVHPDATLTFASTAANSVVREVMFPGSPHEMLNVYHMDGPDLVVTHYCAAGNQPRMRARSASGNSIAFRADGVTNLTDPSKPHMAELTLIFNDDGTLTQDWKSMQNGELTDHAVFRFKKVN